jgi:hypothetical protein
MWYISAPHRSQRVASSPAGDGRALRADTIGVMVTDGVGFGVSDTVRL